MEVRILIQFFATTVCIGIPLWKYVSLSLREKKRKRVKLSPKIGSMKETLPYIGLSFNPSRLVLSCWAACFFFVQHFSIYQALLRMRPTRATRRATRTSRDAPRIHLRYICSIRMNQVGKKRDTSCNPNIACMHMVT